MIEKVHGFKVTPKIAAAWLAKNTANRKMRPGVLEKYTADMTTCRWTPCPAPIVFYEDGSLADGQHRLQAIILSDTTQTFDIWRDFPRGAGINIDTGLSRTLVDSARISGAANYALSNELLAVVRGIEDGVHAGSVSAKIGVRSNSARLLLVDKHREAAEWAINNGPSGRGLRNGITLSAIGRAWYHELNKDRLRKFCEVLSSGFYSGDGETAAVALRSYLQTRGPSTSSSLAWRDLFLRTQNAIHYFMRGRKLTVIKAVGSDVYPLPDAE